MYRVSAYNDSYVYLHNLVTPEHTITRSLPADKSTLNFYGLAITFEEIVIFYDSHFTVSLDFGVWWPRLQTLCCTNDRQCWFTLHCSRSWTSLVEYMIILHFNSAVSVRTVDVKWYKARVNAFKASARLWLVFLVIPLFVILFSVTVLVR